jgi:hypothetical protein
MTGWLVGVSALTLLALLLAVGWVKATRKEGRLDAQLEGRSRSETRYRRALAELARPLYRGVDLVNRMRSRMRPDDIDQTDTRVPDSHKSDAE